MQSIHDLTPIDVTNHPILFNCNGHENTSKKYRVIPTASMIKLIMRYGWIPHEVIVNDVRKPNREGYQTHRVFFHHPDLPIVNDTIARIMLTNAYDARKSYIIALGALKFACANGMYIANHWSEERVVHSGDALERAITATHRLTENAEKVTHSIERFSNVTVDRDDCLTYNREAIKLRYDEKKIDIRQTIQALDNPNRYVDQESNLWSLFNRVQENILRGKHRYMPKKTDDNPWPQFKKARAIKGIDASDKINRGLWELTERFAVPSKPKQLELIV